MEQQYDSIFPEREVRYAGFLERFVAALIDGILLFVVNFVIDLLLGFLYPGGDIFTFIFKTGVNAVYYAALESGTKQATFGKDLMGIKVIDSEGGRISFWQGIGRYFGKYLSTIILFIGFLMVLWDSKKQALHDKLASTYVILK